MENPLKLNTDQIQASKDFFYFLNSNQKEFFISGSAGTGKTYLLNYLLTQTFKYYKDNCKFLNLPIKLHQIVCTATTHKATEILNNSLGDNFDPTTIHSFLNLIVYNDYKTGEEKLKIKPNSWKLYNNTLLIIDEASMINYTLHDFIKKALIGNSKIVYIGDANQLTAVKSTKYSVFDKIKQGVFLNKIERNNSNSNLVNLCNKLKENISNNITESFDTIKPFVKTIGKKQLKDLMINKFDKQNIVYLAYTNKSVNNFNKYYRTKIKNLPLQFQEGETLINSTHIMIDKLNVIRTEQEVRINNLYKKNYNSTLSYPFSGYYVDLSIPSLYLPNNQEDYKKALQQEAKIAKQTNDWSKYFEIKNTVPILRSKEAQTVHKSQGSTYDFVVIDINDLATCKSLDTFNRLLYVACSRAKHEVYMYCNDLE